jgi:hypothetical protein
MMTILVSKKRAVFLGGGMLLCVMVLGACYLQPRFLVLAKEYVTLVWHIQALIHEKREQLSIYTNTPLSFLDASRRSGITFRSRVVPDAHSAQYDHGMGVIAADVNNDSTIDLFFVAQVGDNELWLNRGEATFTKQQASDIAMPGSVKVGAAFADLDNDADPDLIVSTVHDGVHVFRNEQGTFSEEVNTGSLLEKGFHSSGVTVFDYNLDGFLDILVTDMGEFTATSTTPSGYLRAKQDATAIWKDVATASPNRLFAGNGDFSFKEVAGEAGISHGPWSGSATIIDGNGDGRSDIYQTSMFGPDTYYERQPSGTFTEATSAHFNQTPWGSMHAQFADLTNDGSLDLFVADMHADMSKEENPVGDDYQKEEAPFVLPPRTMWGNAFFEQVSDGTFSEVSNERGLETFWPWGSSVGDLDNDGDADIFITAGMGYGYRYGFNSLLENDNGKIFRDVAFLAGIEPRNDLITTYYFECQKQPTCASAPTATLGVTSSRSSLFADLNDDGLLDIVVHEYAARPRILINNTASGTKEHVSIELVGTHSNRDALGSTVTVRTADLVLRYFHNGTSGYLGQSTLPLHVGTAPQEIISIQVQWPDGTRESFDPQQYQGTFFTLVEGSGRKE